MSLEDPGVLKLMGAALLGAVLSLLTQRLLQKRGLFTYVVRHTQLGLSRADKVFGTVRVTWNDQQVPYLYSSTIDLRNESLNDYENVVVRVLAQNSLLLTDRAEVLGTTQTLQWSEAFLAHVSRAAASDSADEERRVAAMRREYLIATMNRGEVVRFIFLNAEFEGNPPLLKLEIVHKGVAVEFRVPQPEFMGVPQPAAASIGAILGVLLIVLGSASLESTWIATTVAFAFGLIAQVPGALFVRLWRWLRDSVGG